MCKSPSSGSDHHTTTRREFDPLVTLIVPVYNEEEALPVFVETASNILAGAGLRHQMLFVDDGSTDGTRRLLAELAKNRPGVKAIFLSRNFGKEAALSAGIDHAAGDVVVPIDADLQDPPEMIPGFVEKWREGFDVVYGIRATRDSDAGMKRVSALWFYRIFNSLSKERIPKDAGDFRLIDRKVVEALKRLPERNRFMKGLFAWVGFRSIGIPFERPERLKGTSKWGYWRLWNFALDGFVGFTTAPLRLWLYIGATISVLSFLYALIVIIRVLIYGIDVPGYASLMTVILFLGGIQLLSIGTIGEYLARLFLEAKQRPVYVIDDVIESPNAEFTSADKTAR